MEQLLCHLVGDYILQTDAMANRKTKSSLWALAHVVTYALPFLLITRSPAALGVIAGTHFFIDRFRLARYVVAAKNSATDWGNRDKFFSTSTGYLDSSPPWLATWLLIIADNTCHMLCNYVAIRWL
jgi:hypothetical protein